MYIHRERERETERKGGRVSVCVCGREGGCVCVSETRTRGGAREPARAYLLRSAAPAPVSGFSNYCSVLSV